MRKCLLIDSVFIFVGPNTKMSNNILSFKFFKETFISNKLFRSFFFFLQKMNNIRTSDLFLSFSFRATITHSIELGASLELRRNLCSFKWLNFNSNLDNNLTPTGLWIAKGDLCFKLKNSLNIDLRCLIFSTFSHDLSSLCHPLTHKGKTIVWIVQFSFLTFRNCFGLVLFCCKLGYHWNSDS